MSLQADGQDCPDCFSDRPLVIEPSRALLSSDGGLLPIRQFDERVGLTGTFARTLEDSRDPDLSAHTLVSSGVRALASSRPDRSFPSLRLSLVTSRRGAAPG